MVHAFKLEKSNYSKPGILCHTNYLLIICENKIYFHACREPKNLSPLPFLRQLLQMCSRKMKEKMKGKENMEPKEGKTQKLCRRFKE